jgi:hypothetical protein
MRDKGEEIKRLNNVYRETTDCPYIFVVAIVASSLYLCLLYVVIEFTLSEETN